MTWLWLPELGRVAQLLPGGRVVLWERSRLPGVWRPVDPALDQWWALAGRAS